MPPASPGIEPGAAAGSALATAPAAATLADHFGAAWNGYRAHWRAFVFATLVLFASWVTLEMSVVALYRYGLVPNVLLHLAFAVFASGLIVGIHAMALEVLNGGIPQLGHLTTSLARGPSYLIALFIYLVAVAVGLVLLVAPGVLVAVRHALIGQVLATRKVTAFEALRNAGELSRGRWWAMFRVLLAALALNVAGASLLGVGLLVAFPVSVLAVSSLYRALARERAVAG